ncbi:MAG: phosphoribosylformylglycinamidine synthase subunit PurS [Bacteroidetes bacterium]|nr:phosphoribosylformylglycinamidine synthase subunit PurS [Bacteroidota bacterium]
MNFTVHVHVMPLKDLLDPQGKAVLGGLSSLGITGVKDVRIGKKITLNVEAANIDQARAVADSCAKQLLCNAVMEYYEVHVDS